MPNGVAILSDSSYRACTLPQNAAKDVAGEMATDIADAFAGKVNSSIRGQSLNPDGIERALMSGNGGASFPSIFFKLFEKQGGANAKRQKPAADSLCLNRSARSRDVRIKSAISLAHPSPSTRRADDRDGEGENSVRASYRPFGGLCQHWA